MSYIVNELLVDSLANSKSFQRFAVRTSKQMDEISSLAAKKKQQLTEQMKDISESLKVSYRRFPLSSPGNLPSVYLLDPLAALENRS